jgi:CRP-like cAMP-binding protein
MTPMGIIESLRESGFVDGMADEDLMQMSSIAEHVEYPCGKVIFRDGDPATHVYIICDGKVSLEICGPGVGCRRILTVTGGELLGWSPALEQSRMTATARTLTPVTAVEVSGQQLLTLCEHNPRFGYVFMRRTALELARRLTATRMQLLDLFAGKFTTPTAG